MVCEHKMLLSLIITGTYDHASPISDHILDVIEAEFDCKKGSIVSDEFSRLGEVIQMAYRTPPPDDFQSAFLVVPPHF